MAYDRESAWEILGIFSGQINRKPARADERELYIPAVYDAALDELARLGENFDRERAWGILAKFSAAAEDYAPSAWFVPQDNTMSYTSALDQLEACYS